MNKTFFCIFYLFLTYQINSQDIVEMKAIYLDNQNIAHRVKDDSIFTGIAQHIRRNGHLVYEEIFINGVITTSKLYFNLEELKISNKTIYNENKPYVISKEFKYNLKGQVFEIITYDVNGKKALTEQFKNDKLIYSCEFNGKKKHGFELNFGENGNELLYKCEYRNGKKHGTEICIKKNGTKRIRK